jgi:hypothetical protein
MKKKIDVSKKYKTRDGQKVKNLTFFPSVKEDSYCIAGVVNDALIIWDIRGSYTRYSESVLDLIEVKEPWEPKDKEVVWGFNNNWGAGRELVFYDKKNGCAFSREGKRNGECHDNYEPYEGKIPKGIKKIRKVLED